MVPCDLLHLFAAHILQVLPGSALTLSQGMGSVQVESWVASLDRQGLELLVSAGIPYLYQSWTSVQVESWTLPLDRQELELLVELLVSAGIPYCNIPEQACICAGGVLGICAGQAGLGAVVACRRVPPANMQALR